MLIRNRNLMILMYFPFWKRGSFVEKKVFVIGFKICVLKKFPTG